ncbi:hypothetical protein ABB27_13705 [Stenotrophomonas terrae]|uniref:Uncharacterized protein n=2 Tax=Stenotrophomonas terrae TaxID=405446 RepID=A0A0R0C9Z8_9GAMM|nr:hypothetical protein ABB27_13705 [Stenotrophomonas terrae]
MEGNMDNQLLEDIRALLISKRAREIRINLQRAESDADIEEIDIEGELVSVLTLEAAMRAAVKEFKRNKQLISTILAE